MDGMLIANLKNLKRRGFCDGFTFGYVQCWRLRGKNKSG